jgi:hypothetical protein
MAKAKFDAKEFFLNYGDRLGLGIAGLLAVLLLVFAMLGSSGGVSADQVKDSSQKASSAISRSQPDADVIALKGEPVKTLDEIEKLSRSLAHLFSIDVLQIGYPFYSWEPRRGKFRSNPEALRPVEIAAIPLVGAFKVYDTKVDGQGMWVMVLKPKNAANAPKVPNAGNRPGLPGGPGGFGGGQPPPPGGMMGGGLGIGDGGRGGGQPGGMGAPGGRGGRGGRGGGAPAKQPANQPPPAVGNPGAVEDAYEAHWKLVSKVGPEDTFLGVGLRPVRNALIVASYPHSKQVDEIARKLQLEKGEVANWYRGLDVQRRVVVPKGQLLPDGKPAPVDMAFVADPKDPSKTLYRPVEEVDNLIAERERLNDPNEDVAKRDALAGWVKVDMRRVVETMMSAYMVARTNNEGFYTEKEPIIEQLVGYAGRRVAMPLPKMPRNDYPLLYERLPQLQAAVKKIKDDATARIPPPPKDPRVTKGNIGDDPFGALADDRRGEEKPNNQPPPTRPSGDNAADVSGSIPDLVLVRFVDVDLDPEVVGGMTYEYRIRMVLDNPNWGKEQDVAAPDFAKIETIAGQWSPAARVSFQPDTMVYADERQKSRTGEERDKVPVQIHQWLGKIETTARDTVTVGDWWIERMIVARGDFVGKSPDLPQNGGAINLIQWISYAYDSVAGVIGGDVQKRTYTPASLTRTLLVDFNGGAQMTFKAITSGTRRDDVPAEVLLLEPDGRLTAHALVHDRDDEGRKARFTHWEEWGKKLTRPKENTPAPGAAGGGKGLPGQ